MMESLTLDLNVSAIQDLPLDTEALDFICGEDWIHKCSWTHLKNLSFLPHIPLHFALQDTLYVPSTVYDSQRKFRISKKMLTLYAYVLPLYTNTIFSQTNRLMTIRFWNLPSRTILETSQDFCIAQDISLRVDSHVWLRFFPNINCSSELYEWDGIFSASIFDSLVMNNHFHL